MSVVPKVCAFFNKCLPEMHATVKCQIFPVAVWRKSIGKAPDVTWLTSKKEHITSRGVCVNSVKLEGRLKLRTGELLKAGE